MRIRVFAAYKTRLRSSLNSGLHCTSPLKLTKALKTFHVASEKPSWADLVEEGEEGTYLINLHTFFLENEEQTNEKKIQGNVC